LAPCSNSRAGPLPLCLTPPWWPYLALALLPGPAAQLLPGRAPLLAFSVMLVYLLILRITSPVRRQSA